MNIQISQNRSIRQSGPLPEVEIRFPVLWLAHAKPKHCLHRERTKTERNGERKKSHRRRRIIKYNNNTVESSPSVNPTISWTCEIRTSSRFPWIRCIRVINFTPDSNFLSYKSLVSIQLFDKVKITVLMRLTLHEVSFHNPGLPKINKGWFWPRQRWSALLI